MTITKSKVLASLEAVYCFMKMSSRRNGEYLNLRRLILIKQADLAYLEDELRQGYT